VGSSADVHTGWAKFVDAVAEKKVTLAATLEEGTVSVRGKSIVLSFTKQFSQQLVIRSMEILAPLLIEHFGPEVSLETKLEQTAPSAAANKPAVRVAEKANSLQPPPERSASNFEEVSSADVDDKIQKVLKYFPGTLKKEHKPS
jgi:hypothetical protein